MNNIKIAVTGGGTGGHTTPAISIIRYIKKLAEYEDKPKCEFIYIGSKKGIEKEYAIKENITYKEINTGKLRRSLSLKNISDMFKVMVGFFQSLKILKKYRPNIIFSTGGYVSVPVVLAGKFLKIPVIIHEQTVNVGLANKIASKVAVKIAVTFESSIKHFPKEKTIHTGIPLREEIFTGDKNLCYDLFGIEPKLPLLYITGGSQGSKFINDTIVKVLPELLADMNIIHQCGGTAIHDSYSMLKDFRETLPDDLKARYVVKDYIYDELKHIYKTTNLIVGRSGAGTVSECIALAKPCIFIPLPNTTKDEQGENARLAENIGGAVVCYQHGLTPENLRDVIQSIILDTGKQKTMSENFSKYRFGEANEKIYNLLLKYSNNK